MERQEIIDGIVEILKTVRTIDQSKLANVTEETDFLTDLTVPSTELINIAAKAEQKFGVEFSDDDIDEMGSKMKDIIDLILQAKELD